MAAALMDDSELRDEIVGRVGDLVSPANRSDRPRAATGPQGTRA